MTTTQAAELRVKWKLRVDPPKCEHLNLELEWSDNGLTGNDNCIVCGEAIAKKNVTKQ
jgi:ssDNA-binding Zn-finger/Zn-ribbon topoisomerase 1